MWGINITIVTTIAIVALVLFIQVSRVKKGAAIFLILYVMSVLIILISELYTMCYSSETYNLKSITHLYILIPVVGFLNSFLKSVYKCSFVKGVWIIGNQRISDDFS